jgi:hypothetical protein
VRETSDVRITVVRVHGTGGQRHAFARPQRERNYYP